VKNSPAALCTHASKHSLHSSFFSPPYALVRYQIHPEKHGYLSLRLGEIHYNSIRIPTLHQIIFQKFKYHPSNTTSSPLPLVANDS